jgi:tRNA (adenine57-N1/adenine58-N1)-methyltransferase
MLLVDERDRQYLFNVPADSEPAVRIRGENLNSLELVSQHDGGVLQTPLRRRYLVLKPTLEEIIMNMPRQAQVIFPKDLALMLMWGDVAPGMEVVEVGCGHGALTMTILRALGHAGQLVSYDIRLDHLNKTRKNIVLYLGGDYLRCWRPVHANLCACAPSIAEQGDSGKPVSAPALPADHKPPFAQRLFTDIPEPWTMLEAAAEILQEGGIWVAYVPTVLQLMQQVEGLNRHRAFSLANGFEAWQRHWHVRPPSVRPTHGMRGHTGFIISARRRANKGECAAAPAATHNGD